MTDDTWDNDMVKEMAAVSNSGACSCIAPDLCSCSENGQLLVIVLLVCSVLIFAFAFKQLRTLTITYPSILFTTKT